MELVTTSTKSSHSECNPTICDLLNEEKMDLYLDSNGISMYIAIETNSTIICIPFDGICAWY